MAKILVTGATGRQGGAVARLLAKRGHQVRAYTRDTTTSRAKALDSPGIVYEWIEKTGYSVDRKALQRALPEVPWISFDTWAHAQDWTAILRPEPATDQASP